MKLSHRIGIVAVVLIAIAIVVALKASSGSRNTTASSCCSVQLPTATPIAMAPQRTEGLPRLVDLGAGKCIPCKMMAPILESLKTEYAGRMNVEFIDVWINPDAGKQYGIQIIPTQIFYDAKGKELFRHEGFYAKGDILKKWKEMGVDLGVNPSQKP
ncbi:MAG: hypothetical protein B9S32_09305 [Verrucomicrobia bacterium Tous-C9LFEB]|nr:MAG: hypothetical protein B9S32_09305 [Verrucomicrobia bacterium Tous-C9LFEB]